MSEKETSQCCGAEIIYKTVDSQGEQTTSTMHSIDIVNAIDGVAHSLWDGLRANGFDSTIPDGLFAVSESLDKIADAINKSRGDA